MNHSSLDQAVIQTMNELMRASSDCAEFDPAMSAKFAAAAKDLGRDLGITSDPADAVDRSNRGDRSTEDGRGDDEDDEDDEFRNLLYLLDLQKKAVTSGTEMQPKHRLGWLSLDAWSRW